MVHVYITLLKASAHGLRNMFEILQLLNILPYVVYSQQSQRLQKLHAFPRGVLSRAKPR